MDAKERGGDRSLSRRELLLAGSGTLLAGAGPLGAAPEGELLYNGIRLPAEWPPRRETLPALNPPPSYLVSPPEVIPIDLGRQLFVDDFLIQETTLKRTFHAAEWHPASPVLRPDRPWEQGGTEGGAAMTFSDGVWYDPKERRFKAWYMGGYVRSVCYATSADGIHWEKLELDVRPGTNVVLPETRDSSTVWLDLEETDPARRYKAWWAHRADGGWRMSGRFSPDGIHWTGPEILTGPCGDRSTVFRNPFRKVWVYSLRHGGGQPRRRRYWETRDLIGGPMWSRVDEPTLWTGADMADGQRADLKTPPELYNLDCVAYESVLLGLFTIWRGQPSDRPKPNEVGVGFSRDGFQWDRTSRQALLPVSEHKGDWNWGNVQSAGGGCLVVGDRLYFYASGRAGIPGTSKSGDSTTGLATLRRDGFASMDAGDVEGTLTTRPLRYSGRHLFVNLAAPDGELRVELLDARGKPLKGYSRELSLPVRGDSTRAEVKWQGRTGLPRATGPVRFRFHLRRGSLYAFWAAPDAAGHSGGYLAAGGPGLPALRDLPDRAG